MWASPLGSLVETLGGHESAILGWAGACERRHCDLRLTSLLGHGAMYWVDQTHADVAMGAC
eukprot:5496602-Pyramimonas_sp.AAC.1